MKMIPISKAFLLLFFVLFNVVSLYHCRETPLKMEDHMEEASISTNSLQLTINGGFKCRRKGVFSYGYCCKHKSGNLRDVCFPSLRQCTYYCGKDVDQGVTYGHPGYPNQKPYSKGNNGGYAGGFGSTGGGMSGGYGGSGMGQSGGLGGSGMGHSGGLGGSGMGSSGMGDGDGMSVGGSSMGDGFGGSNMGDWNMGGGGGGKEKME